MSDLDDLMARLDTDPSMAHPGDLDTLISYYRNLRAQKESGSYKPRKAEGPKAKIDLAALGLIKEQPKQTLRRRV